MEEQGNGVPNIGGAEVSIDANVVNPLNNVETGDNTAARYDVTAEASGAWQKANLPTKAGFWGKFKSFLFQEIKVELTPRQQKIEDDLNAFLFKEITFGRKK